MELRKINKKNIEKRAFLKATGFLITLGRKE